MKMSESMGQGGSKEGGPRKLALPEGSETVHVINMCNYFPYNEYYHTGEIEIIRREGKVLGNVYSFQLEIGRRSFRGGSLGGENTLLLKVNMRDIFKDVSDSLGAFGRWGSNCDMDITNTASSLVAELLDERGYQVEEYCNGFPTMIMLISPINLND